MMSEALEETVDVLRPVELAELDAAAALSRRLDRRYLVSVADIARVLATLAPTHRVLEIAGRRRLAYRSVYFDDPARATLRAHAQGRRRRFKCRTRVYADTATAFFEVKLKDRRGETVKRRQPHAAEDAATLTPDAEAFLAAVLGEAYGTTPPHALAPVLHNRFERLTVADLGGGSRMTCDLGIEVAHTSGAAARLRADLAIVETKSRTGRSKADALLLAAGARPVAFSKYAVGLALTEPGRYDHRWRRVARRAAAPHVRADGDSLRAGSAGPSEGSSRCPSTTTSSSAQDLRGAPSRHA
jgi:hypothetical protein